MENANLQGTILFILDHLKGGGAERIALDLAIQFQRESYQVVMALIDGKDSKMPVPDGITQVDLDFNPIFFEGRLWRDRTPYFTQDDKDKVQKLVDGLRPDLIILSHCHAHFVGSVLTGNVWFWVHGEIYKAGIQPRPNLFRKLKEFRRHYIESKNFVKVFEGKNILVVNQDIKDAYKTLLNHANIQVVANGIDLDRIQPSCLVKNTPKIYDCIFIGRLSPEKQPDHAIKAFHLSGLMGKMAVVGDGVMLPMLKQLCQDLGVEDRVDFLGWQSNPQDFLVQSKALIVSSNTEGSPLVIAESILLGIPVVAYHINEGIRYQLDSPNLKEGLANNQDIADLANKLHHVVTQAQLISETDKQKFSIKTMYDTVKNICLLSV